MRKVIQIAAIPASIESTAAFYALCDDGTMWFHSSVNTNWRQIETVPQDEEGDE